MSGILTRTENDRRKTFRYAAVLFLVDKKFGIVDVKKITAEMFKPDTDYVQAGHGLHQTLWTTVKSGR